MIIAWYQYIELLSLVFAIIFYPGLRRFSIGAFLYLLLLTNIVEFIGANFRFFGWRDNYWLYNIYILLSVPLYLFIFSRMLHFRKLELKVFYVISGLVMLFIVLNYVFLQGIQNFNSLSGMLSQLVFIIFSCMGLVRLSFTPGTGSHLFREPYFWINSVIFLNGLISLVLLGLQPFISSRQIVIGEKSLYHALFPAAIAILYSGFCIAFYLCKPPRTPS